MKRTMKLAAASVAVCLVLLATLAGAFDLRYGTATVVPIGPFVDKTDGVTLETGLTITNERTSMEVAHNNGTATVLVLDNVTGAASGTDNDLSYITGSDNAMMQLELTAANTSYYGSGIITVTDAANHVPVWLNVAIISAAEWDAKYGTTLRAANVTHINGTTQTGRDLGASVLISSGTGTGQLSVTSGRIDANMTHVNGTAQTGADLAAGQSAIAGHLNGTLGVGTHTAQTGDSYGYLQGHLNGSINAGAHLNSSAQAQAIDTLLSTTHGNGSWDATGGAVPTVEQIDTQLSNTHGPGPWVK